MKKFLPYILGGVVLLVLVLILMSASSSKPLRRLDQRITLRQTDKIPYGTRVARELLSSLFPNAETSYDKSFPGEWNGIRIGRSNQAVVLMSDYLDGEDEELSALSEFVENGNYVFIVSRAASDDVASFFKVRYRSDYYNSISDGDSLKLRLVSPAFTYSNLYSYPGFQYAGTFGTVDTTYVQVLGRNEKGEANFIQLNKGKGSFFIHTAPLAFSNYFILHKNNADYYQQVFSVLPKNITALHWNDYFLDKRREPEEKAPNWLGALSKYPSFKWGLLLAALALLLVIILGMRRKQRMIPLLEKPKNDSLDFVKTLGRLYYDRKDHKNLASKMIAYFLEHVRSRYKIPTHILDEGFIKSLHFKSGYPEADTASIITTIHSIREAPAITDQQLSAFHKQLEGFYQNT